MPLGAREVLLVIRAKDQASRILMGVGSSFNHLSGDAKKAAQHSMAVGSALLGVGVGLAATGALALKWLNGATQSAMDYNKTAALTLTQADQTKVKFKDVRDIGLQVARDFPVAFDSVQKAFYDIFSSIDVNVPQAKALLVGFAQAATAGNVDIQTAGRATIAILNAYKLPVSSLHKVLDLQFQLVRKGVGTYEEFATTIGRAIPSSVRAGQSFSTLAGMLAFLTRNGLSASMASASAARALDAMAHPVVAKRLEKMGISVRDMHGNFRPLVDTLRDMNEKFGKMTKPERAKALQELFKGAGGTIQARRFFDTVFSNFDGFQKRVKDMGRSGGSMMEAFGKMIDQPANKALILQNRFKALKIQIGQELIPAKVRLMEIITKILGWWNKLSPSVQSFIIKGLALVAVIVTLIGIFMAVVGAAMIFNAMLAFLGVSLGGLLVICGWVVLAIVAIVIIVILVIKYHKQLAAAAVAAWDWIKKTASDVWNNYLSPIFTTMARFLMQTIPHAFWACVDAVKGAWHAIQDVTMTVWEAVTGAIATAWDAIFPILQSVGDWINQNVVPVFVAFGELVQAIMDRVRGIFWQFYAAFMTVWDGVMIEFHVAESMFNYFFPAFMAVVHMFWNIFVGVAKASLAAWRIAWNLIFAVLKAVFVVMRVQFQVFAKIVSIIWRPLWNMLWATVKFVFNIIKTIVESALQFIKGIIQIVTGIISGDWSKVWQGIKNVFGSTWTLIIGLASGAWDFLKSIFSNGINALWQMFLELPGTLIGALGDLGNMLWDVGKAIIQGLIDGVKSMFGLVTGAVGDVIKGAIGFGKSILGIGSPSKVTRNWGQMMGQGMINGLLGSKGGVQDAFAQMTSFEKVNLHNGLWKAQNSSNMLGGSGKSGRDGGVVIHPGAIQLTVHGNLDSASLPKVRQMLDDTLEELTRQLS